MANKEQNPIHQIFCRSVGPGGTTVSMYPTNEGIKCIWHNENIPYTFDDITADPITYEASDKHNVSIIPWDVIENMAKLHKKGKKF